MSDRPLGEGFPDSEVFARTTAGHTTAGRREPGDAVWTTLSATRIGSVHLRDDLPLQDAVLTWQEGDQAVLAVADGHGHRAHFRSDTGAALAVVSAVEELRRRLPGLTEAADDAAAARLAHDAGLAIIDSWTSKVRHHIEANPYDEAPAEELFPYGTTILATAVAGGHLVFLQVGDGDSVLVDTDGRATKPLPVDPDSDGPYTSSLCQPDPARSLRVAAVDAARAELAFLCTDGFGNSRVDAEGWWRQTGEQLAEYGRSHGWTWVAEQLDDWLEEPARVGGDDTTLAILARA